MDKYRNFNDLKQHERRGIDYDIQMRTGTSGIAVIAPHGGGIEPGTGDIAERVAGREHAFYCFKGIKKTGNAALHITSDQFDEPEGIKIAEEADCVLTIHGCSGTEEVIYVGGNNLDFRKMLLDTIAEAGFAVKDNPSSGLAGLKSENICNRGRTRRGGQIELSQGLRKKMFEGVVGDAGKGENKAFFDVVAALRKALNLYCKFSTD
jgi:phage replication-related protein YjqB (UPF0714/DUF867 family)